jgi:hypothetical protein
VREYFSDYEKGLMLARALSVISTEKPETIMAKMIFGAELGFSPGASQRMVYITNGKAGLSADGMVALSMQDGCEYDIEHSDPPGEWCKVTATRGGRSYSFTFTMEMAKKAGLVKSGGNYEKYPWDMLYARAAAHVSRKMSPARLAGIYTPEELPGERTVSVAQPVEQKPLLPTPPKTDERAALLPTMEVVAEELGAELMTAYLKNLKWIAGEDWREVATANMRRIVEHGERFIAAARKWDVEQGGVAEVAEEAVV